MKSLLTTLLLSITLMLGSCGSSEAGASFAKTITDGLAKVTTSFDGIKDADSAKKAIALAESTLPKAKAAFSSLEGLGKAAGATDALKKLMTGATGKFGDLKTMLGGLVGKFSKMPDVAKLLGDKIPALLKMLPGN